MDGEKGNDVTKLLRAWSEGDSGALEQLTPLVYEELHRRAKWHMARERVGHTLQATALVNEIYVRMVDLRGVSWRDRAHFFAIASRLIRRVLIDRALQRGVEAGGAVPTCDSRRRRPRISRAERRSPCPRRRVECARDHRSAEGAGVRFAF